MTCGLLLNNAGSSSLSTPDKTKEILLGDHNKHYYENCENYVTQGLIPIHHITYIIILFIIMQV